MLYISAFRLRSVFIVWFKNPACNQVSVWWRSGKKPNCSGGSLTSVMNYCKATLQRVGWMTPDYPLLILGHLLSTSIATWFLGGGRKPFGAFFLLFFSTISRAIYFFIYLLRLGLVFVLFTFLLFWFDLLSEFTPMAGASLIVLTLYKTSNQSFCLFLREIRIPISG